MLYATPPCGHPPASAPRLLPAPRLVCLPAWCSLEDGDGSGCNMLLLPLDLARHLANSNETLLCPNCLAGRHQASPAQRRPRSGRKAYRQTWPPVDSHHVSAAFLVWQPCSPALHPAARAACTGEGVGKAYAWPGASLLDGSNPLPPAIRLMQCYVCKQEGKADKDVYK